MVRSPPQSLPGEWGWLRAVGQAGFEPATYLRHRFTVGFLRQFGY